MITSIKKFFEENFSEKKEEKPLQEQLDLAAAALLIEISYSDHDISEEEKKTLEKLLEIQFNIAHDTIQEIVSLAEEEVRERLSSYEFTRLINTYFESDEKFHLVQAMWEIAFADGNIDRYEEAMIRKLADLLYVPHSEFIRAKLAAQDKQNQQ